ncbi:hypothetical protein P8452_33282 [Trifolium repens]|nr:hypothetical protein P8452_33282 [Trifolium repens]
MNKEVIFERFRCSLRFRCRIGFRQFNILNNGSSSLRFASSSPDLHFHITGVLDLHQRLQGIQDLGMLARGSEEIETYFEKLMTSELSEI